MIHDDGLIEVLNGIKNTNYGKALKQYLQEEMDDLDRCSKAESWDDALGRKHATKIITKLFPFLDLEKKEEKKKTVYN